MAINYDISDDDASGGIGLSSRWYYNVHVSTTPLPHEDVAYHMHSLLPISIINSPLRLFQNQSLSLLFFVYPASSALWTALQACQQSDTAGGLCIHTCTYTHTYMYAHNIMHVSNAQVLELSYRYMYPNTHNK